jgi:hypothetical protein
MTPATIQALPRPLSALETCEATASEPTSSASPSPPNTPEIFDSTRPLPRAFRDAFGNLQVNPYIDASGHSYHVQMSPNAPGVALGSLKRPVPNLPLRNMVRDFLRGDAQWRRNGESPISYELPEKAVMMVTMGGEPVGAGSAFDIDDIRALCRNDARDPLTRMPLPQQLRIIPNLAVHEVRLETEGTCDTPAEHTTIDVRDHDVEHSAALGAWGLFGRIGATVLSSAILGMAFGGLLGSMTAKDYAGLARWLQGGALVGAGVGMALVCSALEVEPS